MRLVVRDKWGQGHCNSWNGMKNISYLCDFKRESQDMIVTRRFMRHCRFAQAWDPDQYSAFIWSIYMPWINIFPLQVRLHMFSKMHVNRHAIRHVHWPVQLTMFERFQGMTIHKTMHFLFIFLFMSSIQLFIIKYTSSYTVTLFNWINKYCTLTKTIIVQIFYNISLHNKLLFLQ